MSQDAKNYLVIFIIIFCKISFAGDSAQFAGFKTELEKFNNYQTQTECKKALTPTCPSILDNLIKDDFDSRAFIIKSRAPICRAILGSNETDAKKNYIDSRTAYALYAAGRFNYLGDYSHSVIKSCVQTNQSVELDKISKFYYYNSRLNQGAVKIAQERALISKLLGAQAPTCPAADFLAAANKACQQMRACPQISNLHQLSQESEKDEELYSEILNKLKSMPKDCETIESCKSERANWTASLLGITMKNPWLLDADYKNSKGKKNTKERIAQYLKKSDENLLAAQNKIQEAAFCLHGQKSKNCDLDDLRETLNLTPELPETYVKDKIENKLTTHMHVQSCLEEAALDRNRTGKIMTDAYWNIGLTIGTFGLGVIGNSARLLALGTRAKNGRLLAEATNLSFDIYGVIDSVKDTINSCSQNKLNFEFRNLNEKEICENGGSALSASHREESSCLISSGFAGVAALVAVPGGLRLYKLIQQSGYIKTSAPKVAGSRKDDLTQPVTERRGVGNSNTISSAASHFSLSSEAKFVREADLTTVPNLPSSIKIDEFKKPDGSKALYYHAAEKLPGGDWVKVSHELPIDDISGGINANFPAGRELFEKIAEEKSGRAYLAFIDVGSLGAVNKTFKEGDAAGDRYLKAVADKIIENGEGKITLARLGGDEFGLIIDENDPAKVKILLEKIQKEIRLDLNGDAKKIFREEKIERAKQYKSEAEKIKEKQSGVLTESDKAELRKGIDELAKIQQPDISIGSTQIGHSDQLASMLERAEAQAKEMKTQTALKFGRSAEKYGSDAMPNLKPDPMFRAKIAEPVSSSSWTLAKSAETSPDLSNLREITYIRKEDVKRIGTAAIARYENEIGQSSYRVEHYITDQATGERKLFTTEIPTRGNTGLLDGAHPESQKLIMEHVQTATDSVLVMPKLTSLKYLNYYESGTRAGDEMLEAVSDILKNNMRSSDLSFKLNGADFLWSLDHVAVKDIDKIEKKLNAELLQSPKVKQILENERMAINKKIEEAVNAGNTKAVIKLKEKMKAVNNFKPDLTFRTLSLEEANSANGYQEILKKFDEKFKK